MQAKPKAASPAAEDLKDERATFVHDVERMDAAQRFGLNLRIARRLKGITQEELASRVYLDRCAISRMETGNRYPRLDRVLELAYALDIGVRDLLHGIE